MTIAAIAFVFWPTSWRLDSSPNIPESVLNQIGAFCDQHTTGMRTTSYLLPADLQRYSVTGKVYRSCRGRGRNVFYLPTRTGDRPLRLPNSSRSGVEGYIYDMPFSYKTSWEVLGPTHASPEILAEIGLVHKRRVTDRWFVAAWF